MCNEHKNENEKDLLACPFCNHHPQVSDIFNSGLFFEHGDYYIHYLKCHGCNATVSGSSIDDCINNWNMRSDNITKKTDVSTCPFCNFQNENGNPDFIYPVYRDKSLYQLVCGGCEVTVYSLTPSECLNKWNQSFLNK